jgi:hypothetical protein
MTKTATELPRMLENLAGSFTESSVREGGMRHGRTALVIALILVALLIAGLVFVLLYPQGPTLF